MKRADRNVLNETYRAAKANADTIRRLVAKTEDEDLAVDLNRQLGKYQHFLVETEKRFRKEGERPLEESTFEKARSWLGIQTGTMLNNSTPHIANMVMSENAKGIGSLIQALRNNNTAQNAYCEFANELMDFSESSIDQLKYYLNM